VRRHRSFIAAACVLTAMLAVTACGSDAEATSRPDAVRDAVDRVVAPAYRRAVATTRRAAAAGAAACTGDAPLTDAAAAIADGYRAWLALDPIDFGPATTERAKSQLVYPPDPERVGKLLAAGGPEDAHAVNTRTASDARGFGAATALLADGTDRPARCRYLTAVLQNNRDVSDAIGDAWFRAEPPYVDRAAGRGPKQLSTQAALDMLINMSLNALGADATQLVAARLNEEDASGTVLATRAHLDTIAALWGTSPDTGLRRLTNDDLGRRFAAELRAAQRAGDDPKELGQAINAVRATLGTEVVSALDIVVGFSDNDGDS
jgi:predicted lipoprotein